MRATVNKADSRVYERETSRRDHTSQELSGFEGILLGVLTGGLLWLALAWFVFRLL